MDEFVPRKIKYHCPKCGHLEVKDVPQKKTSARMTGDEVHSCVCDPCDRKRIAKVRRECGLGEGPGGSADNSEVGHVVTYASERRESLNC